MPDPTLPARAPDAVASPAPASAPTHPDTPGQSADGLTQPLLSPADLAPTEPRTLVQQLDDFLQNRLRTGDRPIAAGYRIVRKLGEGTYGTVWLAEDRAGVRVAIKFFAHGTGQQWQMLQDEVKSLASLDTTFGIVQLKEVEPDADPPYFVMSFAEGGSLQQKLERGPLPLADALRYFTEIARALAFVHAKGIRHCDLKPGNVLLNQHGQPMIADFGQAHLSDDAAPALGTFFYMAPEQAEPGLRIPDTRWDVYGLGAVAYALLTGEPPRKDAALSDELRRTEKLHHRLKIYRERIRTLPPPAKHRHVRSMDRMLADVIDRCLELDPEKRLRDAGAVLDALETRRRQRRQRPILWLTALASLAAMLLVAGAGMLLARAAVADTRADLSRQQLASNQVTAELAANVLRDKFRDRILTLEDLASPAVAPDLPRWIAAGTAWRRSGGHDRTEAFPPELKPLRDWLLRKYLRAPYHGAFTGLAVVDPDGFVLARAGLDDAGETRVIPETAEERRAKFDRSYAWRDWFNGVTDYNDDQDTPRPPVRRPHVSQPYVGRYFNKGHTLVNVVVPIWSGGAPAGLLLGSVSWEAMQHWLTNVTIANGFAVVADDRGHCLCHQETQAIRPAPGRNLDRPFAASPLAKDKPGHVADHRDPVTGRTYLAGYAPFRPYPDRDDPWLVLVQHDPEAVLGPVTDLQHRMRVIGRWALAIMTALIGGLWGGLIWTLRREERLAHG
jgi:hypothetical protein